MHCGDHDQTTSLFVDMDVSDFADFMFKRNVNDSIIELTLGGVENTKDLFCFLVDLLCKGLVLMFGHENRVEVDSLTQDDFLLVKKKMALAGVEVILSLNPNVPKIPCSVNVGQIDSFPDDAPLETYPFVVVGSDYIHTVHFKLMKTFTAP